MYHNKSGSTLIFTHNQKKNHKNTVALKTSFQNVDVTISSLLCVSLQALTKGGVTYKDEVWHKECFLCTGCKVPLAGQPFTSQGESPYCVKCFSSLYAKKCAGCNTAITGEWHSCCLPINTGCLVDLPCVASPLFSFSQWFRSDLIVCYQSANRCQVTLESWLWTSMCGLLTSSHCVASWLCSIKIASRQKAKSCCGSLCCLSKQLLPFLSPRDQSVSDSCRLLPPALVSTRSRGKYLSVLWLNAALYWVWRAFLIKNSCLLWWHHTRAVRFDQIKVLVKILIIPKRCGQIEILTKVFMVPHCFSHTLIQPDGHLFLWDYIISKVLAKLLTSVILALISVDFRGTIWQCSSLSQWCSMHIFHMTGRQNTAKISVSPMAG